MIKQYFILIFLLIFYFSLYSQKEANIWYFGENAGLNFNYVPPIALTNGALVTAEGCATICDQNGNIVLYTNGVKVWNKAHNQMPNGSGLMGNNSSTQSCVVIPKPLSSNICYIFTVDAIENNLVNGLRYSVVDLNLNNGLGDIISKNNLLFTPTTEKVTAVLHNNAKDFWVIGHKWNSNSFYAYLVSESGINLNPVISNVGMNHSGYIRNAIGYMKASPNGDKLALAIESEKVVEIFDFDNSTGQLSNTISFSTPNNEVTYGIEFSSDGSRLYVDSWDPSGIIYQFDLLAGTPGGIANSAVQIFSSVGTGIQRSALQLAPDKKIYVARRYQNYLGVINNPNELGLNCNYTDEAISLAGKNSRFGLPTYIQSIFNESQNFTFQNTCFTDTTYFFITNTFNLDSVYWDFNDPASGLLNYSTLLNPYHIFSSAGSFNVKLISYFSTNIDTVINTIIINPSPEINLGNDTSLCYGDSLILNAGAGYESYFWQDGSADSTYIAYTTGIYWVEVTDINGCTAIDSIIITFFPLPEINLGNDTSFCYGEFIILNAGSGFISYLWQDGSTDSTYIADTSGIYWVKVTNPCGFAIDSIVITVFPSPEINLENDTSICFGDSLILNAGAGYESYLWQDGSTDSTYIVDTTGIYWIEVSNEYGCITRDTIIIGFYPDPQEDLELGNDTSFCFGEYIILNAGSGYTSYLWQDGSTDSTCFADTSGIYWVMVTNPCGSAVDSIVLTVFPLPVIDLGNDTSVCYGEYIFLDPGPDYTCLWQDGSTNPTYNAGETGIYWVEVTDG
ncbi:MAG: hypothetical protein K8R58_01720, partial [Bacteroidales bacterium]|nr:hypothetical protein [Bacteroidales bacterium]